MMFCGLKWAQPFNFKQNIIINSIERIFVQLKCLNMCDSCAEAAEGSSLFGLKKKKYQV